MKVKIIFKIGFARTPDSDRCHNADLIGPYCGKGFSGTGSEEGKSRTDRRMAGHCCDDVGIYRGSDAQAVSGKDQIRPHHIVVFVFEHVAMKDKAAGVAFEFDQDRQNFVRRYHRRVLPARLTGDLHIDIRLNLSYILQEGRPIWSQLL